MLENYIEEQIYTLEEIQEEIEEDFNEFTHEDISDESEELPSGQNIKEVKEIQSESYQYIQVIDTNNEDLLVLVQDINDKISSFFIFFAVVLGLILGALDLIIWGMKK